MMTSIIIFLYLFDQIINRALIRYKGVITPVYQRERYDCGLACVSTLMSCYGNFVSLNRLRKDYKLGVGGLSLKSLMEILTCYGIQCCCKKVAVTNFHQLIGPAICHFNQSHYVVFLTLINEEYYYFDPARGFCYASASASAWQDMASGFVLLPLHRARMRQDLKGKLIFNFYYNSPFNRYIYYDLLLSITLWLAVSSFPDHRIIMGFCYAITTVYLLRMHMKLFLYRLKSESSPLTHMTRFLFNYQSSLFRRLRSCFFYIYFVLAILSLFSSLCWFSLSMLISEVIITPLIFWLLILHGSVAERHYIKLTYSGGNGKHSITASTLIIKVCILLLVAIVFMFICFSIRHPFEVFMLFSYVALLSFFLFSNYLDFKELFFISNAYDIKNLSSKMLS